MDNNRNTYRRRRGIILASASLVLLAGAWGLSVMLDAGAQAGDPASAAAPAAVPVSVAPVQQKETEAWDAFSGRLEAIERVDVRSRVSGAVLAAHFREGALVKAGDLLISIDPAPYAAEVARQKAAVSAAQARVSLTKSELDRGKQLSGNSYLSKSDLDQRANNHSEAVASLEAAEAALQAAQLNLDYTEVRAPVSGRVGRLEITTGNLVAAGPGAPVLTSLVSVDPIYVQFSADENVVFSALQTSPIGGNGGVDLSRIPVEITTGTGYQAQGRLRFVDNQVDPDSGTVRMRAIFDNPHGRLMPGQFARVRLGRAKAEDAIAISERAIGTDQNKKFVLVVGDDNKAVYREIQIGKAVDGLRVVTTGLNPGERIVVNGLQHIRPGALVEPRPASMDRSALNDVSSISAPR